MGYRSVRELLELPVVTGRELHMGDVQDAFLDLSEQRLIKFAVTWTQMPDQVSGSDEDLPFGQVVRFEPHQVVVQDEIGATAGLDFRPQDEDVEGLAPASSLLGAPVRAQDGRVAGNLADVYVDEADGAVVGFEITLAGRPDSEPAPSQVIPPARNLEVVDGALVVPERLFQAPNPLDGLQADIDAPVDRIEDEALPDRQRRSEQPDISGEDLEAQIEQPSQLDEPPITSGSRLVKGMQDDVEGVHVEVEDDHGHLVENEE